MPEPYPRTELGQPRLRRRSRGLGTDPEPARGPPHPHRIAGRIGRRQQQQPPRLRWQGVDAPAEAVLNPPRQRAGQPEPARQLRRRRRARQLQQRQRIAPRFGDDLLAHPRIDRPGQRRIQQRPRITLRQTLDLELRQPSQLTVRNPGRKHQAYRFGPQPTRHERQCLRRRAVKPLRVIDQAHHRPLRRRLSQQAEGGQPDQEPVRRRARAHAERGPQRLQLRTRQHAQPVQQRRAQLMQPGERQLHLRLHARHPQHPAPGRLPGQVLQQRRLAHPRLAVHHQHPALTGTHRLDQPVQHAALGTPVRQPAHTASQPRRAAL